MTRVDLEALEALERKAAVDAPDDQAQLEFDIALSDAFPALLAELKLARAVVDAAQGVAGSHWFQIRSEGAAHALLIRLAALDAGIAGETHG